MLAKKNRLTGRKNFLRVEAEGKVIQSENFGIAFIDRKDDGPPRFAFIVSTKIAKNAVDRNAVKRKLSESVRIIASEVKDGLDVVFLAKTSIVKASSDKIMSEVRGSVRNSEIVK